MSKSKIKTQDVVVLYTKSLLNLRQIAQLLGVSHTAVSKHLKKAGVLNSKVKYQCAFCGKECLTDRSRYKQHDKHYCNMDCYAAAIENPGFYKWRHGQRLAKAIVSQYFYLKEGYVVHHKDGDNRNNNLDNLQVFASQAEHMRQHRGGQSIPLWDGSNPTSPSV